MSRKGNQPGSGGAGDELVEVAYADDAFKAEMIQGLLKDAGIPSLLRPIRLNVDGPLLGFGLLARGFGGGPQRVMVHANRAEQARALLAETLVDGEEERWPEIASAKSLEEAGGKARDFGLIGAYARAYLWAFAAFGVAFGIFLLLHAG